MKKLTPVHPGEILAEDFMKPLCLSQYRLAKEIGVPARRHSIRVFFLDVIGVSVVKRLEEDTALSGKRWTRRFFLNWAITC
jgi:antitoxin HigA-1